jgi:hypothetical protein
MAGAGEVVVLDAQKPRLEEAQTQAIRAKMLQDTLGSAGKNIMDIVTQYEDLKQQKQKNDLASITMAGTLSGGMDKLPQDTKNRLPGILGVPLPTDDKGNVQVTPDTETVIKRKTLEMIQNDPDAARVIMGLQEKRADPFKLASDQKQKEMQIASDREKMAHEDARAKEANAAKIDAALISAASRQKAAETTAGGQKVEDQPSPFVLDPKTNTMMSEPQWYSTYPGQQMPAKLTFREAKAFNEKTKTDSLTQSRNASVAANEARVKNLNFKFDQMMANPDPNDLVSKQIKHLTDLYRAAPAGSPAEKIVKEKIEKEMPNLLKSAGFKDDDINALSTMAGDGGWGSWLSNKWHSWMGLTATDTGPSLRQSDVGRGETPTTTGAAAGSTGTMTYDEFQKAHPRQ